jgi:hypothetical protein
MSQKRDAHLGTGSLQDTKETWTKHDIIIKTTSTENKKRILKAVREEKTKGT